MVSIVSRGEDAGVALFSFEASSEQLTRSSNKKRGRNKKKKRIGDDAIGGTKMVKRGLGGGGRGKVEEKRKKKKEPRPIDRALNLFSAINRIADNESVTSFG